MLLGYAWLNSLIGYDAKTSSNQFTPLSVTKEILEQLGNPQDQYKTVHIAGTNGKGTVSSLLSHFLVTSNKFSKVGLMTSPHIVEVEERCQINGKNIDIATFNEALLAIKKICDDLNCGCTYFVAITCASFKVFSDLGVDIAIVEVGLGGRKDATNLIKNPLLSIITSIGLDHQEQLGNTIEEIAKNKAGIIKTNIPVLTGYLAEAASKVVVAEAREANSAIFKFGEDYTISYSSGELVFKNKNKILNLKNKKLEFTPPYFHNNLSIALMALTILKVDPSDIVDSLDTYHWPRRFNIWNYKDSSYVIVDGAHNVDGVKASLEGVSKLKDKFNDKNFEHLILISMLRRKNWKLTLEPILEYCQKNSSNLNILELDEEFVGLSDLLGFDQANVVQNESGLYEFLRPDPEKCKIVHILGTLKLPISLELSLKKLGYALL